MTRKPKVSANTEQQLRAVLSPQQFDALQQSLHPQRGSSTLQQTGRSNPSSSSSSSSSVYRAVFESREAPRVKAERLASGELQAPRDAIVRSNVHSIADWFQHYGRVNPEKQNALEQTGMLSRTISPVRSSSSKLSASMGGSNKSTTGNSLSSSMGSTAKSSTSSLSSSSSTSAGFSVAQAPIPVDRVQEAVKDPSWGSRRALSVTLRRGRIIK
jgi:hypothetical protein